MTLTACKLALDSGPDALGELRPSCDLLGDPAALQARMDEDGYLYVPGFFDIETVAEARMSILRKLADEGGLDPDAPLDEARPAPGKEFAFRPDLANGNPAVFDLLYSDRVMAFYGDLFGEPARHYDYTWLRAMSQGMSTYPHFDIVYMGRGTHRLYTLWCPLCDVPRDHGGLMILEGSHRIDWLRENYGNLDVDTFCENDPGVRQTDHHGYPFGAFSFDPVAVRERFGGRWLTTDYRAGDLLTFSMFTLHASLDNHRNAIRLSTDSRYQPASEPADERWIGEVPIAHGPDAARGLIC